MNFNWVYFRSGGGFFGSEVVVVHILKVSEVHQFLLQNVQSILIY